MSTLLTARFHTTVAQQRQLPEDGVPEIAFIGRSNAGKSSAINVLCNRRRLAFSSRTPGRTQALNYFAIGRDEAIDAFLVDMPGYGYAAAPGSVRGSWDALAGRYLHDRASLRGAVLMVDIRREITELDQRMLQWLSPDIPLVVLVTKCDKVGRSAQTEARKRIVAQLAKVGVGDQAKVLLFSATAHKGIDEGREAIEALVHGWPVVPDELPAEPVAAATATSTSTAAAAPAAGGPAPAVASAAATAVTRTVTRAVKRAATRAAPPKRAAKKKKPRA